MYEVTVRSSFSAAHHLRGYRGKCEKVHGHNWTIEVSVGSLELDKCGMVMDFTALKGLLRRTLSELDHSHLNKLAYFRRVNPSSENIAKYIYDRLAEEGSRVKSQGSRVKGNVERVVVWETENSRAEYRGESSL